MTGISFDLSTGDEFTDLVKELRNLKQNVAKEMQGEVARIERQLDRALSATPPKPPKPIQWTSEKQRRWVYANIDLPHIRRGIQKLWIKGVIYKDGTFTVFAENPSPAARWVYSSKARRQRFLLGWVDPEKVVIDATIELDQSVEGAVDKAIRKLK